MPKSMCYVRRFQGCAKDAVGESDLQHMSYMSLCKISLSLRLKIAGRKNMQFNSVYKPSLLFSSLQKYRKFYREVYKSGGSS
jgi:hypothetical protein